jgi:hypothetical protein
MTETETKWAERVREWKASGQVAEDYARGRGFAVATLRWWSSRLGRGAMSSRPPARTAPVRMVRVVRAARPTASVLTVRVGAAQVEVPAGFDRTLLRELVAALGGAA